MSENRERGTIKITKQNASSAVFKFIFDYDDDVKVNGKVRKRTESGGNMLLQGFQHLEFDDFMSRLPDIFKRMNEAKKIVIVRKRELPKPFGFSSTKFDKSMGEVRVCGCVFSARVKEVVAIEPDGALSSQIANPNKEVWFNIECWGRYDAVFNVIYNGEVWHPVQRYKKQKITESLSPKASVNLANMNLLDKELMDIAIQMFVEKDKEKK